MKVHELGEFGLIEMLSEVIAKSGAGLDSNTDLTIGIGDDAAAWRSDDAVQLGTTDMLVQDVHFTLNTIDWQDLGWKSLAVNISDIAAMGGTPTCALISLGLPPDTETDDVARLYQGMAEIARQFDMGIVGGNITQAPLLVISPGVIGRAHRDGMLTRSGARPGDRIAVTGYLGASAAGLKMLKESLVFDPQVSSALKKAHLRPDPRVIEGQLLVKEGVKAAIDISDGLIGDLTHICEASKVKAKVRLENVPVHPAAKAAFDDEALALALTGGEDYELIFTAPLEMIQNVGARCAVPLPITVIGEIEEGDPGKVILLDKDGKEAELTKGGWDHFNS